MAKSKLNSSNKKLTNNTISTLKTINKNKFVASVKSVGNSLKTMPIAGVIVAEFIGTFLITMSFLEMQANPLFFGFALIGTILIVGGVSGAHLNPAITIGALTTRKISALHAFLYITAQILGAIVAWMVINEFSKYSSSTPTTTGTVYHAATVITDKGWYLFCAELLGATILSLGVANAVRLRKNKIVASFVAGLGALIALYITLSITTPLLTEQGTSSTFLNPAIAIASNAITFPLTIWPFAIYIIAPVLGGIAGFLLQDYLNNMSDNCDCNNCDC